MECKVLDPDYGYNMIDLGDCKQVEFYESIGYEYEQDLDFIARATDNRRNRQHKQGGETS